MFLCSYVIARAAITLLDRYFAAPGERLLAQSAFQRVHAGERDDLVVRCFHPGDPYRADDDAVDLDGHPALQDRHALGDGKESRAAVVDRFLEQARRALPGDRGARLR